MQTERERRVKWEETDSLKKGAYGTEAVDWKSSATAGSVDFSSLGTQKTPIERTELRGITKEWIE